MSVQVGQISTQLTADVSNFTTGMKQAQASFLQTTAALKTGSSSIGSSLGSVTSGVKTMQMTLMRGMGIIGAGFILPKLFMKAKSAIIDFNQTVDQSTIALTHFVGSSEGAERLLGTLQQFAARTPFNFQDLLGTTQQMMAMGVEAKELIPRLTAIGDAAAGMGGSPEIMQRITRALGQIQAKGRVQAEELMQLAEVGIPAYQYIATLTGGDIPAALDKMKRGQIDAGSAITAILDGLSGDFNGMMDSQSKTMMGAMSTVEDFVQMTVAAIGRPVFEALRGTMLEVANFLGSDDMVKGAAVVAENISNAMSKAGEVVGKILQTIGPVIKGILGNIYDMAAAIGQGLAAAQPFLFALAGAFMVVVGSVTVLSKAISPFLGLLKTNKTLATALVAVLIILALKKKLVGTNSEGAAKAGTAFAKSLKDNISGAKEYIQTMQRFSAAQGKTLGTMGALRVGVVAGFRAMGAAVKSFLTSMLPMLAMVIAVELIVKAFEAFGAKQRVTDERTKELTSSINDQTIALLENAEALQEGAKGTDILYEAIFKTGAESEKLIAAFGILGKKSNTADISAAAGNFEDFAKKTLMAKGVTEEMAAAIAKTINISDNNTFGGVTVSSVDANGNVTSAYVALTDAQIKMAESLEVIQDTIENTDFSKIVDSQANNLIGLGKLTEKQLAHARVLTDSQFVGKSFTQAQYDMALSQNIVAEATDAAREALLAEARVLDNKKTDWMRYRSAVGEANAEIGRGILLINQMRDADKKGIVDTDEFISSLMGEVQAFHEIEKTIDASIKSMGEYIDTLAKGEDSNKKLMNVGYEVNHSLLTLMNTAESLGVGQEEVTRTSQQMIQEFVDAALEAGYLETEIQNVISVLRIAANLDPTITIYMNLDQAKLALFGFMTALEAVMGASARAGVSIDTSGLMAKIKTAQDAIAMLSAKRPSPPSTGSSGSKTLTAEEKRIEALKDKVKALKQSMKEYRDSLIAAVKIPLSEDIATKGSALQQTRNTLKEIREYQQNLKRLRDKKVPSSVLQEVIAAGMTGGNAIAKSILGMSNADYKEFTTARKEIDKIAKDIGTDNATAIFQPKIDKAQIELDFGDALSKIDWKSFGEMIAAGVKPKTTTAWADMTKKQQDAALSKVNFDDVGKLMAGAPKMASGGIVSKATFALIGESGAEAVIPLSRMGEYGGSSNTNITINMPAGSNGDDVVRALRQYQRSKGTIPVQSKPTRVY